MRIQSNISLFEYNTFNVRANAKYFVELTNTDDISDLRNLIKEFSGNGIPYMFLGEGSNVLFTKDYNGLVIKISNKGIKTIYKDDVVIVHASAGEKWDDLISYCINNSLYGLENLSMIPGSVGASVVQNIGAYGIEVGNLVKEVLVFDIDANAFKLIKGKDCEFGYRQSIFKQYENNYIVIEVKYLLSKKAVLNYDYEDIRNELSSFKKENIGLKDMHDVICKIRKRKLPDVLDLGNAGSFYKNPIIDADEYEILIKKRTDLRAWKNEEGGYKVSAGWLIDKCGYKGFRKGDAGVYENQALILVNYGNATGKQIVELSHEIIEKVYKEFGIRLVNEVVII